MTPSDQTRNYDKRLYPYQDGCDCPASFDKDDSIVEEMPWTDCDYIILADSYTEVGPTRFLIDIKDESWDGREHEFLKDVDKSYGYLFDQFANPDDEPTDYIRYRNYDL